MTTGAAQVTPKTILDHPATVLAQEDRAAFFEQGYLRLESFLDTDLNERLHHAFDELIERYRHQSESTDDVLIENDHAPDNPRFKRINRATDKHPVFWTYAANSVLTEAVSDLVGPAVRYRESYINCKSPHGGDAIDWHQDFPFFPHTNKAMLTVLTFLEEVTEDMGPIQVFPGSHRDVLYDHYNADGSWAGKVSDTDMESLDMDDAVPLCGPAGTLVILDCCTVHGSAPNRSGRSRPLLLTGYSSADAFPFTTIPANMRATQAMSIVRGETATHAHHEPVTVKMPPDWAREQYVNIFDAQKSEPTGGTR